jgi:lysophospholipase
MPYYISTEKEVDDYPTNKFMEFFKTKVKTGTWKQVSGATIFYGYVINDKASKCVVISQGRSESLIKYAEVVFELYQNGFTVFMFDHQGQGQSSRALPNPHIGYVRSFDDYVEDFHVLLSKVTLPLLQSYNQAQLPLVLLCHSMGAAIGVLYVQAHPTVFSKLVLSAPMLGIATPIGESCTFMLANLTLKVRGLCKLPVSYFFGQADYDAQPFDKNTLTNSEVRYRVFCKMMDDYPQNKLGGISINWLLQAIMAMRKARLNASLMALPVLVLQAEQEQIVDNAKMTAFVSHLPQGKLIKVEKAKHELLFEKDEARKFTLLNIFEFISQN